jgi:uncharacterized membrane protein YgdD (TMEM256/DUF423 family)
VSTRAARAFAGSGALVAGVAVALSAVAMHAADGTDRMRLAVAAAIAFGHGLALVAIVMRGSRLAMLARVAFAAGIAVFAGSLVAAVFLDTPTALAPAGGFALMLGWAILAVDFLRTD